MGNLFSSEGRKLLKAIAKDDTEAVRTIVARDPHSVLYTTIWRRRTPLILACKSGNVLTISTLLWACEQALGDQYIDYLNEVDTSGNTAVHVASKYGRITAVRILLEEGASPLYANQRGVTALHLAAHRGHTTCVELLLDAPVRSSITDGNPLAAYALVHDISGPTRYINSTTNSGFAPLHLAAFSRSSATVSALVQRGAALDVPVTRGLERLPFLCGGSTPLHISAAQGDIRTCVVLLEGQWRHPGLELRRARNMLGLTPLNCALLGGHHDVVRVLVEASRRGRPSLGSPSNSGSLRRPSATLQTSFPESLRRHMLNVLRRAILVVQLREIAGDWKNEGLAKPSDADLVNIPGIESLTPARIQRLQSLLERPDASLRDVLFGLEEALRRRTGGNEDDNLDEHGLDLLNADDEDDEDRRSMISSESSSISSSGSEDEATTGGNDGDDAALQQGRPRRSTHRRTLLSRPTLARGSGGSNAAPASNVNRGAIDWSILRRANELRYFAPHLAGGGSAAGRRERRERRERRREQRREEHSLERSGAPTVSGGSSNSSGSRRRRHQRHQERASTPTASGIATGASTGATPTSPVAPPLLPPYTSSLGASSSFSSVDGDADDARQGGGEIVGGSGKAVLISTPAAAAATEEGCSKAPFHYEYGSARPIEDCAICMDASAEVAFKPCNHSVCFHCACQLCLRPSDVANCPFCRQQVGSVVALAGARDGMMDVEKRVDGGSTSGFVLGLSSPSFH